MLDEFKLVLIILPRVDILETKLLDVKLVTTRFSLDVLFKLTPANIRLPILATSTIKLFAETNPALIPAVVMLVFIILPKVVLVIVALELEIREAYRLEVEIFDVLIFVLIRFDIVAETDDKLLVLIDEL